jgi:TPR repeat protein
MVMALTRQKGRVWTMNDPRISLAVCGLLLAASAWSGESEKGLAAYNSTEYDTALAIWQPLAEAGDAESQYGLGMMYGNGFGVAMDDALAIKWYGMAAEQGHGGASCNLAVMHQNGWGVPLNEEEAIRLFMLAAEQGVAEAMVALGRHFAMDFSEAYDPVEAYKWFSLAAMLEDIDAKVKRENIAEKLTAEQVADGNAMVALWSSGHTDLLAKQ